MKVRVDHDVCQGHAACFAYAPEVYALDHLGYSSLHVADVRPGMEDAARRGAAACPEGAISIEE